MREHSWLEARFGEIRPKALAALTRYFRDLDIAEEALALGCVKALTTWPKTGLPEDPFAWLLVAGRNAGLDLIRRNERAGRRALAAPGDIQREGPEAVYADALDDAGLRDDVLRLLFICCHPSLSVHDQASLALKVVAGLSVEEIARAFLVKPKTMEQRLTRAKHAITAASVPFETPDLAERYRRLRTVSLMVYLLFNEGWSASSGDQQIRPALCEEAIRLVRLLLDLFPAMTEGMGLLALFLFQHSRRNARLDELGRLVLLDDQDRTMWDQEMIGEATTLLEKALRHRAPGPYQIQAAIAAVHAQAPSPEDTDWEEIERLYAALAVIEPSAVIELNHAAAVAKVRGPQAALALIEPLAGELDRYRWYHGARAEFLFELGRFAAAKAALQRAMTLNPTVPEQRLLQARIDACEKSLRDM